jgi:hypothetical protein
MGEEKPEPKGLDGQKNPGMFVRLTSKQHALIVAAAEREMIPVATWARRCLLLGAASKTGPRITKAQKSRLRGSLSNEQVG